MQICIAIVNIVRNVVEFIIAIVEWVVETVCNLVTTVIRTVVEVCDEVCGWLGIFSFICDWVCRLVEVFEEVVEWVCEEILLGIIRIVRIIIEYVFYILTWVCWVIDWIPRSFDYLSCRLGLMNERHIHLCLKILTRNRDTMTWTLDEINTLVAATQARFDQCNIRVCVLDTEIVETEDHRDGISCGFGLLFTGHHHWYRRQECRTTTFIPVTVFFVEDISTGKGCSIPGTNYVLADREASHATIAHEIGHLADLWGHDDDPNNVMFAPTTNDSREFTEHQCCMIRSSKYVTSGQDIRCRRRIGLVTRLAEVVRRDRR